MEIKMNNFEREIINAMKKGYKILREQKERSARRLGTKVTINSLAYPYVLYDEMAHYIISAKLPDEDLQILSNCPDIYVKALDYFIHHFDVRLEAYAKCIDAILEEEKKKKDAA